MLGKIENSSDVCRTSSLSEIGHEQVILGDDFTGQMTQPTVSEHRRTSTSRTNPSRLSSV